MGLTIEQKIKQAVEESKAFPNPTIEYNFDYVDTSLFEGVNAVYVPTMQKNSAKVIYKFN